MKLDKNKSTHIKAMVIIPTSIFLTLSCLLFNSIRKLEKLTASSIEYTEYYSHQNEKVIRLKSGDNKVYIDEYDLNQILESNNNFLINDEIFCKKELEKAINYYNYSQNIKSNIHLLIPLTTAACGVTIAAASSYRTKKITK